MNEPKSEQPARELPPRLAWQLKDYGLGPEPQWGTPEWMEWVENRALCAAFHDAADALCAALHDAAERKKQGR
jgi:hypothetical protein